MDAVWESVLQVCMSMLKVASLAQPVSAQEGLPAALGELQLSQRTALTAPYCLPDCCVGSCLHGASCRYCVESSVPFRYSAGSLLPVVTAHSQKASCWLLSLPCHLCHLWHLAILDTPMTAGEMFHFVYELQKAPYLHYGWTDAQGNLQADMPITRGKDRVRMCGLHEVPIVLALVPAHPGPSFREGTK